METVVAGRGGQPSQHKDNPFQWAEKSVKSGRRPWAQTKRALGHKSMRPHRMYPRVLGEVSDVTVRVPLKFSGNWKSFLFTGKKTTIALILKKGKEENPVNYESVNLTSTPGEGKEQIFLKTISNPMKKLLETSSLVLSRANLA